MAVRVLPRVSARAADHVASLPGVVLAVMLAPSAIDLLKLVQPSLQSFLLVPALAATGLAALLLLAMWLRFPRTNWLAAAGLAAVAALVLRFAGADVAPWLSLLAIVGVGLGGGFATPEVGQAGV